MFHQAFHPTQAGRMFKQFHTAGKTNGLLFTALHDNGNHGSVMAVHLSFSNLVAGMIGKSRVKNLFHGGLGFKKKGDGGGIFHLTLQPEGKCGKTTVQQPAIKRRGDRPADGLVFPDLHRQFIFLFYNDTAAQHVGMSAEKFSRRMKDQVCAQLQRFLNQRCGPGIVATH